MRIFRSVLGVVAGVLLLASGARAQSGHSQRIIIRVVTVRHAEAEAPAAPLSTRSTAASIASASYAIATNEDNQKIAASLDRPLPEGVALSVALAAPMGATGHGATRLGTEATDVLSGIPASTSSTLPMTYALTADRGVPSRGETRTVTYTIVAGQ